MLMIEHQILFHIWIQYSYADMMNNNNNYCVKCLKKKKLKKFTTIEQMNGIVHKQLFPN